MCLWPMLSVSTFPTRRSSESVGIASLTSVIACMDWRFHGVLLLGALLLGGCATSLRDVRAQELRYTRSGIGTPDVAAHCVQDYLEEHFGGFWGRLGGLIYEVRREDAASHLIGRHALIPADVFFDLSLTPAGGN